MVRLIPMQGPIRTSGLHMLVGRHTPTRVLIRLDRLIQTQDLIRMRDLIRT